MTISAAQFANVSGNPRRTVARREQLGARYSPALALRPSENTTTDDNDD